MTAKIIAGQIYPTDNYGDLIVTNYRNSNNVSVRFLDTGFKAITRAYTIRHGGLKDKLHPSVHGVGYVGEGKHTGWRNGRVTIARSTWSGMITRCYCEKTQKRQPTYIGCTVHPDWQNFQVFADWFECNYVDGLQLDKDLLIEGNKLYGPDTCVFITPALNLLFNDCAGAQSMLPTGVSVIANKYVGTIYLLGKQNHLGMFNTPDQAYQAWRKAKASEIVRQALLPTTPKILFDRLLEIAERTYGKKRV